MLYLPIRSRYYPRMIHPSLPFIEYLSVSGIMIDAGNTEIKVIIFKKPIVPFEIQIGT
jgi:hypothetical protein